MHSKLGPVLLRPGQIVLPGKHSFKKYDGEIKQIEGQMCGGCRCYTKTEISPRIKFADRFLYRYSQ